MRFIGRRDGRRARAARADALGGGEDGRQRPHHAVRRVQLRRPGGDRRRGAVVQRARRRRSSARHLYAPEMHDPDLIIRTSGEQRLSNYLLWQSAYSELHFTDVLWPDFGRADLEFALAEFDARRRRFGGPLMASLVAPPRASARAGATRRRTSARASGSRSRRSPSRSSIVAAGGSVFAAGVVAARLRLPARAVPHVRGAAAGEAGRLPRARSAWPRRRTSAASTRCCSPPSRSSRCCSCSPWRCPSAADVPLTDGMAITLLGDALGRPRDRARDPAARAAARRRRS